MLIFILLCALLFLPFSGNLTISNINFVSIENISPFHAALVMEGFTLSTVILLSTSQEILHDPFTFLNNPLKIVTSKPRSKIIYIAMGKTST